VNSLETVRVKAWLQRRKWRIGIVEMSYGKSNGHVTDDKTLKVQTCDANMLKAHLETAGDAI